MLKSLNSNAILIYAPPVQDVYEHDINAETWELEGRLTLEECFVLLLELLQSVPWVCCGVMCGPKLFGWGDGAK